MLSATTYADAFAQERARSYPLIDAFERRMGTMVDRDRLEAAARVLACPVKANPPCWQHGRLIYAVAKRYLEDRIARGEHAPVLLLDIGTAKGFSALCLKWAVRDAGVMARVVSVDVIDPDQAITRNTVAEVDGLKTLAETLEPWPEARGIEFMQGTGASWLRASQDRVHVAVVDGKHTEDAVRTESMLLADRQHSGDVIFFDDLQIQGVAAAVNGLRGYDLERLEAIPGRKYAIARKQ